MWQLLFFIFGVTQGFVWGGFDATVAQLFEVMTRDAQSEMLLDDIFIELGDTYIPTNFLSEQFLNSIDVFFFTYLQPSNLRTADEAQGLQNWVTEGGVLIFNYENEAHDINGPVLELFGVAFLSGESSVDLELSEANRYHTLLVGFTTIETSGASSFTISGDFEILFSFSDNGEPVVVVNEHYGRGAVLIVGDADVYRNSNNERFMKNIVTWVHNMIRRTLPPTLTPTLTPTFTPTLTPTTSPTLTPSSPPTFIRTAEATRPAVLRIPTFAPTELPTPGTTESPTQIPFEILISRALEDADLCRARSIGNIEQRLDSLEDKIDILLRSLYPTPTNAPSWIPTPASTDVPTPVPECISEDGKYEYQTFLSFVTAVSGRDCCEQCKHTDNCRKWQFQTAICLLLAGDATPAISGEWIRGTNQ